MEGGFLAAAKTSVTFGDEPHRRGAVGRGIGGGGGSRGERRNFHALNYDE